jgi:Putative addiction module component
LSAIEAQGIALLMSALAIKQMSWDEKLRAMEELWVSLSQDESRPESPLWHQDVTMAN